MLPHDVHDPKQCFNNTQWTSRGRDSTGGNNRPVQPPAQSCPESPTCPDYVDDSWRSLNVPHDFVVEGTFAANASENHGFLPFDIGWYRKSFELPAAAESKLVYLLRPNIHASQDSESSGCY
jgi:hypothetical protein